MNATDHVENGIADYEMEEHDVADKSEDEQGTEDHPDEDRTYIKEKSDLLSDTSLQAVDLGTAIIDQHFHDVLM